MYGEFCIAKDLIHPNIVEYKYFMRKYDAPSKNFEFHIIMELMEGEDMDKFLKEAGNRPYMVDKVKEIGGQLISGLKYLHDRKIIHQDLKPENILFSGDYEKVKLIDLGVSNRLEKTKVTRAANQGTMRYMAPEQLNGSLSFKTDIWAFACVILQFCTGIKPFEDIKNEIAVSM
jgi:serine/threonine protein kinase